MAYSVTLTFNGGQSLLNKTDLLLTFDQQSMQGMYQVYNPTAWKVTAFPAGGGGVFQATYTATLAFSRSEIQGGIVEAASYYTPIDVQEQTNLTVTSSSPPETYAFSTPVAWPGAPPGQFQCNNQTGDFQTIGVGFYEQGNEIPDIGLVYANTPGNSSVAASFTPILSAYVITGFQESQVIKAQIQSNLKWSKNLADPNISLIWTLEETSDGFELIAS